MNEAVDIVELFKRADRMMGEYLGKISETREHIIEKLQKNVELPHGVRVALKRPDDKAFLVKAHQDLKEDIEVLTIHQNSFKRELGAATKITDISRAEISMMNWPNNADRSMESVLDYDYLESDILPPPHVYWQTIERDYYKYFCHKAGSPEDIAQATEILRYLNTVENPWR
ncbi:hypothetical protein BFP70_12020 [Thioclava sp. SK-1]|uniref:hypothetical protein n=1 Tax=Thioclava sp. SK-1 TaxID=1889770 RepID=UPI0008255A77|nr:hypothetical protein [Thioclava sp. SK-1]OCX63726.1 hypothetical protein BFP70_12020 [Thioclava sp. SK-1]